MIIKDERLTAFIELYQSEFGITLSRTEAHKKASLLLQYVQLCIKPLAKTEDDTIMNKSNTGE